jgi:uncharacterized protein YehS (DUF1456 family)
MLNNDVLRSLRYLLDVSDSTLEAFCQLADYSVEPGLISACLLREDEAGYRPCNDVLLAHVLEGWCSTSAARTTVERACRWKSA